MWIGIVLQTIFRLDIKSFQCPRMLYVCDSFQRQGASRRIPIVTTLTGRHKKYWGTLQFPFWVLYLRRIVSNQTRVQLFI